MEKTLKQRVADGGRINVAYAAVDDTPQSLKAELAKERFDLVFVDLQHSPVDENALVSFCKTARELGIPVTLRIPHPSAVNLIGHWLDLGPLSIVVPLVETMHTALAAVESFYYPPIGRRSWGPDHGFDYSEEKDRAEYARWWNENGILMLQLESVEAIMNSRGIAVPGVDILVFGGGDLSFSLEAHPEFGLRTFRECRQHVVDHTKGTGIKIALSDTPLGTL